MLSFIVKRLYHGVIALFLLTILVFIGVRSSGDPVAMMFQAGNPTEEQIMEIKEHLGLNEPYALQYLKFLGQIVTLDLGKSYQSDQQVSRMIFDRMGATIVLALASTVVAVIIAFPVGILSAVRRGSLLDLFGQVFAVSGISLPNFWLGIMFILLFAVHLRWLPPSGYESFAHIVLPAVTLGLISSGFLSRLVRSSMLDTMRQNYIVTARAKGIQEWRVILFHGFRNALIPTVTCLLYTSDAADECVNV